MFKMKIDRRQLFKLALGAPLAVFVPYNPDAELKRIVTQDTDKAIRELLTRERKTICKAIAEAIKRDSFRT